MLKRLITIKTSSVSSTSTQSEIEGQQWFLSSFQKGYGDSKNANGNHLTFATCIEGEYSDFLARSRKMEAEQERLKAPIRKDLAQTQAEQLKRETALEIVSENIDKNDAEIAEINDQIIDLPANPFKYGVDTDRKPKMQFYFGVALLLPIIAYLLVFYMSASYSAFFKNFESADWTDAVFDPNAITSALNDGWLEVIFVCTIPFVFMGTGYLIHMFWKSKHRWLKISALLIITFVFDMILAYQIELKIYDFNKSVSSPEFNLGIALVSVRFWGIIFGGFVVYVIWGLVLDFVAKEYESIDKVKAAVRTLKRKKEELVNKTQALSAKRYEIKADLASLMGKINQLNEDLSRYIFPMQQYLQYHNQYFKGWKMAVEKEIALPKKENDALLMRLDEVDQKHLRDHKINVQSQTEPV